MLKIITLNLLIDLTNWNLRGQCILEEINDLDPDIIAFQEVLLPFNSAQWIANHLDGYQVFLVQDTGLKGKDEALAILTRIPLATITTIDLVTQNRKAQVVTFEHKHQYYTLINTHLFWQDGFSSERLQQAKRIHDHLATYPVNFHKIICGDFNTTPDSPTIHFMKENYFSALESYASNALQTTFPTPLLKQNTMCKSQNQSNGTNATKSKLIDYIFLSKSLRVSQCEVIFKKPHPIEF